MKWRKTGFERFAGLEEGSIVKEILLALGGLPRGAKKITYLSNGLQYRMKMPDKSWRMCRIYKRPQGDWGVEFWQVKPPRKIGEEKLRDLGRLKQVIDAGFR